MMMKRAMRMTERWRITTGVAAMAMAAGGCVTVTAPEKPIVITLNVNITQEVVYRLDSEAKSLIQQNQGIF